MSSDSKDALLARFYMILDEALVTSERTGQRKFEAELHRARGELLLKRDPPAPRLRRKHFGPPSPSRKSNLRASSNCAPRCRSPSSINRPAVPWRPTPSSRPRSKAFRQRRRCPRWPRRRRCLSVWINATMGQSLRRTRRQKADGGWARYERDPPACRDPGFGRGLIEHNAGLPPRRYPSGRRCRGERRRPQGDGVNIAARLEGIPKPGTICLSEDA